MKRLKVGDVLELETTKGKAYLQYVHENKERTELIRILPGLFDEVPEDLKSIVEEQEQFFIYFPLKAAYNRRIVSLVGNYPLPHELQLPTKMRTEIVNNNGIRIGWQIVDCSSLQRETVYELTQLQKRLSPWGIWNDTLLAERLTAGWSLENW